MPEEYAAFYEGEDVVQYTDVQFVDDIAIPVFASAPSLVETTGAVAARYSDHLLRYGFVVNPAKYKAEVVSQLIGKGSDETKTKLYIDCAGWIQCTAKLSKPFQIRATHVYGHLGTKFAASQHIAGEVRHRNG